MSRLEGEQPASNPKRDKTDHRSKMIKHLTAVEACDTKTLGPEPQALKPQTLNP